VVVEKISGNEGKKKIDTINFREGFFDEPDLQILPVSMAIP